MDLKHFEQWLRECGIVQRDGKYYVPATSQNADADQDKSDALTVTISTARRDRSGNILEPRGADLEAYRRNPVVLWAHQRDKFPIARVERVWVEDDRIKARIIFDTSPFAREARRLYAEGFLHGWSVGFLPRDHDPLLDEHGLPAGYRFTKWELVELSAVPVPANPEALTRMLQCGLIADNIMRSQLNSLLTSECADTQIVSAPAAANLPKDALVRSMLPPLLKRMREWAANVAESEIRRRQGRIV